MSGGTRLRGFLPVAAFSMALGLACEPPRPSARPPAGSPSEGERAAPADAPAAPSVAEAPTPETAAESPAREVPSPEPEPPKRPSGPLRVLLLSGRNNHDWRSTTPELVKLYEESPRFEVETTEDPSSLDAAKLARFDVVAGNWAAFPEVDARPWGDAAEKAFADFVRSGKGFALFHAASATLHTWPEYQDLAGATWGDGTGHGAIHAFKVTVSDPGHPVTRGLADFWIRDELWHRMPTRPGITVLCRAFSAKGSGGSGAMEPVVIATQLGKGRGFNLVLGHDVSTMRQTPWRALMLRGTEWAATGGVTIPAPDEWPTVRLAAEPGGIDVDAALGGVKGYTRGASRKPLVAVEEIVQYAAVSPAFGKTFVPKLAAFAASDATPDARRFACAHIALVGGPDEVPVLTRLLDDDALADAARGALERMPCEEAGAALRAALDGAAGAKLAGIVNSLGERRDAGAVGAIARLLASPDAAVAAAAVEALGKIGGAEALRALSDAEVKLPPEARGAAAGALLRCADGLLAAGGAPDAGAVYERLSSAGRPKHIRVAAFPGWVACRPAPEVPKLLIDALSGDDRDLQLAALRCVREIGGAEFTKVLAGALAKFPPPIRAGVVDVLGERGDAAAAGAVAREAEGADDLVRRSALRALARIGDSSVAMPLARLAGGLGPEDARLARGALARLRGDDVDKVMIRALGERGDAAARAELATALGARRVRAAVPGLLAAAGDRDAKVRKAALRALGDMADEAACPRLIDLLVRAPSDAARREVETALVAACRRAPDADAGARPVIAALDGADVPLRCALIRVLGRLGGARALEVVRAAVKDADRSPRDAGVRAMADWPTAEALADLLGIARSSTGAAHRVLALRGVARLAALATDRPPAEVARLLEEALGLASRDDERKALLGALGGVAAPEAMRLAARFLDEPALAEEAGLAAAQVACAMLKSHPDEARATIEKVLAKCSAPAARAKAAEAMLRLSKPRNLARDATASSPDGLEKDGGAGGDRAANDGNPATYWDEVDGKDLYRLRLTFPRPTEVAAVGILGYQHQNYAPRDFDVVCDDRAVATVKDAAYEENRLIVAFAPTTCTWIELRITGYYGASPAVRELEVYGLPSAGDGGARAPDAGAPAGNLALAATASSPDDLEADGESAGDAAANDGDPETYWDETDGRPLYKLRLSFAQAVEAGAVVITGWRHHDHAPRDFEVVCDDRVVATVKDARYTENRLVVTFARTRCSWLELRITGCYGRSPAVRELEVHASAPPEGGVEAPVGPPEYAWRRTDTSLSLVDRGRPVWRLNFDPAEGKPYLHPVALADGTVVTALRPGDHPWHRAVWFSWKFLSAPGGPALNYWEEDRRTRLSQGRTVLEDVKAEPAADRSARIEMRLSYRPPDGEAVLTEVRRIDVGPPDGRGGFVINWRADFEAGEKGARLDRTPLAGEPGGQGWGGYAGFSLRLAASTREWRYVNSEGLAELACHGKRARWVAFGGRTRSGEGAVAALDHPSNPCHPTTWYVDKGMPYFGPAIIFEKPMELAPGGKMRLRYRVLVIAGPAVPAAVEREWKAFAAGGA